MARSGRRDGEVSSAFPAHDPVWVKEMVGASHANVARVRELLAQAPQLANAAYDWGFGDWETALGAASHTGNREIALMLIEHGARPDLFTHAMLGNLDVVRAAVQAAPAQARVRGPHGITLMRHAMAGGDGAVGVVEYLKGVDGADLAYVNEPIAQEDLLACVGEYRFGAGADEVLSVTATDTKAAIRIKRQGGVNRGLFHVGGLEFHPVGAPDVRIAFLREGAVVNRLHVRWPNPFVEAVRV